MPIEFVDADAHVVEAELTPECLRRWPEAFALSPKGELLTEGRRYPEPEGPGAGCPPEHGLSTASGINPYTPDGMVADADRDGIAHMVLFPSFGLRAPSIETRAVAIAFAELYNDWIADWCRRGRGRLHGIAVLPVEYVDDAVTALRRAKQRGLVGAMVPPALKTRNLDHPDLDPLWAAAVRARFWVSAANWLSKFSSRHGCGCSENSVCAPATTLSSLACKSFWAAARSSGDLDESADSGRWTTIFS